MKLGFITLLKANQGKIRCSSKGVAQRYVLHVTVGLMSQMVLIQHQHQNLQWVNGFDLCLFIGCCGLLCTSLFGSLHRPHAHLNIGVGMEENRKKN